jgi:hypothetical protein
MPENETEQTIAPSASKASLFARIKNSSKRTKLIAAATAVVVLGGGGAAGYAALQTPEAVVGVALGSAFSATNPSYEIDATLSGPTLAGSATVMTYTSDTGAAISLNVNGTFLQQKVGATLNEISDSEGNIYLNLADYSTLATFLETFQAVPASTVEAASSALNGTWVKLSKTDLASYTGGANSTCLTEATAKKASQEFATDLRNNNFVAIKKELAQQDGNRVFELGLNVEKLKGFLKAVKAGDAYATLKTCYPALSLDNVTYDDMTQASVDSAIAKSGLSVKLYATSFEHKLSKLTIDFKDAASGQALQFALKPNGSHPEKVKVPAKSVSATELIQNLLFAASNG